MKLKAVRSEQASATPRTKAQARGESLSEGAVVKALAAISQTQRLRAFRALVLAGPSGLTPGALAVMLDVSASSLSFHLKELLHAHMATVEHQGRNLIYRADFSRMTQLMAYLSENCCAADPSGAGCGC